MGRGHRVVALCVLALGCGDGQSRGPVSDGNDADAAAGTPDGAAPDSGAPDAGVDVPFGDRTWGDLELLDLGLLPQVAIDADGDVMTLWEWSDFPEPRRCFGRRRAFATSSWGPEHDLVTPEAVSAGLERPAGTTVTFLEDICTEDGLGVDHAGRAAALFIHKRRLQYDAGPVQSWYSGMRTMFDPGSGWSQPEWIGQNQPSVSNPAVAMNAPGSAASMWEQGDQVWAAGYQLDSGWGDPQLVEERDGLYIHEIVLDDRGDGLATFHGERISAARLEGGVWQPPEPIDDPETPGRMQPDIAMNGDGIALLVWRSCPDGPRCELRARRFDPIAGWEAPATIGVIGSFEFQASADSLWVALDEGGNGLAVWVSILPDPGGSGLYITRLIAARFQEGAWTAPELLDKGAPGDGMWNPRIVLDGEGNGLVAWRWGRYWYDGAPWDPYGEYRACTYQPATGFGPTQQLDVSDSVFANSRLELAINGAGVGVAVWSIDTSGRARMFR